MAKTKGKGLKFAEAEVAYAPEIYIDMEDPEDVTGLEIGQKVTVMVTGTIGMLRLEKDRSCLTIQNPSTEVMAKGKFEELSEDD
jgi:predicted nucleic acid-binding protein